MRLALLAVLFTFAAAAQTRTDDLYINPSSLVSSTRLTALAGASVGIAEDVESLPFNYAAVAHQWPYLKKRWDAGATLGALFAPVKSMSDFDNDPSHIRNGNRVEGQLGVMYQFRRFGMGLVFRSSTRNVCLDTACSTSVSSRELLGGLVIGYSWLQEQVVIGAGINLVNANLAAGDSAVDYNGASGGISVLIRPIDQPFRFGASTYLRAAGTPSSTQLVAGREVFSRVVTPTRVSLGGSWRLGPRAELYNLPAPTLRQPALESDEIEALPDPDGQPRGPLLLTAQLDLIFPVSHATTIVAFLDNGATVPAGRNFYVVPRIGAEWEFLPYRLRFRGGGWVEPNYVSGTNVRPHVTTGFELKLFHYYWDWSLASAIDLAPRFLSFALGIGFWH